MFNRRKKITYLENKLDNNLLITIQQKYKIYVKSINSSYAVQNENVK